jgi:hypothetical protein
MWEQGYENDQSYHRLRGDCVTMGISTRVKKDILGDGFVPGIFLCNFIIAIMDMYKSTITLPVQSMKLNNLQRTI